MSTGNLIRLLVLWMALPAGMARGNEDAPKQSSSEAQHHLDSGLALYRLKEYARAVEEFKLAYAIERSAELLFALAQSQRQLGDCAAAASTYRAFLQTSPPKQQAQMASRNLERCRRTVALNQGAGGASELENAVASIDSTLSPGAPPDAAPEPPGLHEAVPEPRPAALGGEVANPPIAGRPAWYRDRLGWGLAASGVAAIAVGVGIWSAGAAGIDAANGQPDFDSFTREARQADRFMALQSVGIALAATGGALAVAGGVIFAVKGARGRRALTAWVSPGPGGAMLVGRF